MSKPTDAERKEVAESLRKNADVHKDMPLLLNVAFVAFGDDVRNLMEETITSQMAAHRLADLIDPTCELDLDISMERVKCSACGKAVPYGANLLEVKYCPHCGARVVSCND